MVNHEQTPGQSPTKEVRFGFGENWTSYAESSLDTEKAEQARSDFTALVGNETLEGKSFLDIGFGQGLALCIATERGAKAVGLDIDKNNLEALGKTARYFNLHDVPEVKIGSILNPDVVAGLKSTCGFDIVHSWGVLHHTGEMYAAIENAASLVKKNGLFILAIYNTHWSSGGWTAIKRMYNVSPSIVQKAMVGTLYWVIYGAKLLVTRQNPKNKKRGMNFYHDVVDWVGGYPYEHATVDEINQFLEERGFSLLKSNACAVPTGCNEFVFQKRVRNGE